MPKQLFQCEKCGSVHQLKKDAEICEEKHLLPTKQEISYSSKDKKSEFPQEVKLWFGLQCVTYVREERR